VKSPSDTKSTEQNQRAVVLALADVTQVIWHMPYFELLAQGSPTGKLLIIARPRQDVRRLISNLPYVDSVLDLEIFAGGRHAGWGGISVLARDLQDLGVGEIFVLDPSYRYGFAAMRAKVPRRFGYGQGLQRMFLFLNRGRPLPTPYSRAHPVDKARAFFKANNLGKPSGPPIFHPPASWLSSFKRIAADVRPPFVALGIGATDDAKQWGADRFGELAKRLIEESNVSILLVGGKGDLDMASAVRRQAGHGERIVDLVGKTVEPTLGGIASSAAFLGNDAAHLHMGAVTGVPCIGIFGASAAKTPDRRIQRLSPPSGYVQNQNQMDMITVNMANDALLPYLEAAGRIPVATGSLQEMEQMSPEDAREADS
jgi:heptosyltransferase-2